SSAVPAGTSTRSRPRSRRCCGRSRSASAERSLDGERALHGLPVVADRAVVLVLAGLEIDRDLGVAAGDRLGLLFDAVALDLDRVRDARLVDDLQRDLAGFPVQLGLFPGDLPPWIGRDGHGLPTTTAPAAA